MPKNMFVLLHFKGHNFCQTLTAGPQFTFMGQGYTGAVNYLALKSKIIMK